jgi:hypothetical protein
MSMHKMTSLFLAIALLIVLSSQAFAAWIVEQEETSPEQGEKVKKVMIFGDDALRMDIPDANTTIIMNFGTDRMYLLDHGQRLYTEVSISEMALQAREMLPTTSPNATLAAQKTADFETINGFACQKIIVTMSGQPAGEIWVTPEIKTDKIAGIYRKFFEMIGMGDPDQTGAIALIGGLKAALTTGFPILVEMTLPDGGKLRVVTTSAVEKNMGPEAFAPPKMYTKMVMPGPQQELEGTPELRGPTPTQAPAAPPNPPK